MGGVIAPIHCVKPGGRDRRKKRWNSVGPRRRGPEKGLESGRINNFIHRNRRWGLGARPYGSY